MKNKNTIAVFVALLLLTVLSRWVSHMWNFTLLGGAFLFAGAFFKDKKIAVALMLSSLLISDMVIGFHDQMLMVYFAYLIIVALGFLLSTEENSRLSRMKILGFSLIGSFSFYVLTNFAVWYQGVLYPVNLSGLIDCYIKAIPFYRNQLFSDVISAFGFFEVARLVTHSSLVAVKNK